MVDFNGREAVLDILLELEKQTEYSNVLIAAVLDKYDYLDGREKAFIKRVSEGTIERRLQLDYVLDQYSKTPVIKMKPLIRALLRMSVYQLLFMEHVPDAAVCNEAVRLTAKRGFAGLKGFLVLIWGKFMVFSRRYTLPSLMLMRSSLRRQSLSLCTPSRLSERA